ncbi:MAG: DUF1254 domain-containing protein [Ilumatobacteraceae bacterium]
MTDHLSRPTDAQLHAYKAVHHGEYLKVTARTAGGTNRLIHTTELPTEGTDPVVTPALDHLYSKAVIDLTSGPVVLEVPAVPGDRYFSIHVTDQEHYTVYDEVRPSGTFAFVRQGRDDEVPSGATVIECRGDYPHLFIRVQLRNDADKANAMAVQEQFSLTGVSKSLEFDHPIEFVLDTHDVYPQNEGLLASVLDYDDTDHRDVGAWVNVRAQTIENNIGAFGPIDSSEPGSDDPEIRAAAIIGHLGLPAEHAIYLPFFVNCDGEMLNGDRPEVFVFSYEPENVREFWSVTRYSLLTRNTLPGRNDVFNAYNTAPDAAGNVTIAFSSEDPNDGKYWMPVIAGEPYYFIVRYYGPDLNALPPGPCDRG